MSARTELDAKVDALHGPGAAAAIDAAFADGTIFNDTEAPMPEVKPLTHAQTTKAAFDRLSPSLKALTKVIWVCTCGEMWSGPDMERDVHRHGSYEPGVHRITGPLFRDKTAETDVRSLWAKEDTDA